MRINWKDWKSVYFMWYSCIDYKIKWEEYWQKKIVFLWEERHNIIIWIMIDINKDKSYKSFHKPKYLLILIHISFPQFLVNSVNFLQNPQ